SVESGSKTAHPPRAESRSALPVDERPAFESSRRGSPPARQRSTRQLSRGLASATVLALSSVPGLVMAQLHQASDPQTRRAPSQYRRRADDVPARGSTGAA